MADPVISAVIDRLFAMVEERVTEEISLVRGVEKEVKQLSKMMKGIQAIMHDADDRRVDETVKFWLDQFEQVAYDTDDVLDEWNYHLLKKQIIGGTDDDDVKKVRCSFLSPLSCFKQVVERRDIALKIKDLKERMDSIFKDKENFSFQPSKLDDTHQFKPLETISSIDESKVGGRDFEKESLVSKLLSVDETKSDVDVISIVGTGGLGKTTLAQLAFNDKRVNAHFDHKIWVCVSDPFDVEQVAKKMIEYFTKGVPSSCSMESLTNQIKELVSGKRILLVLDDVWPHESKKWEVIRNSFIKQVTPLSKVLVTTRDTSVAESMGTNKFQELGVLSESNCWSLVSRIALVNRDEADKPTLEKVGREISKKCSGLPLAAVTIGSALMQKKTLEEWHGVLNSKIWELKPVKLELFPPLFLNFIQFPLELRRCFKYCCIFPKDYMVETDDLIEMWISQGYISFNKSGMGIEKKGYEYVENLVSCSFFQDVKRDKMDGRIAAFKIHDIVHDFAQYLMEKECWAVGGENNNQIEATNLRHLTFLSSVNVTSFSPTTSLGKVRSVFVDEVPLKRFEILLQHLKYVRLLKLRGCCLVKLPEEIKLWIHLRNLDLSGNWELKDLPEEICNLLNLETLNLRDCGSLSKLPRDIGNLINLVHLHVLATPCLKHLPKGITKLKKLRSLERFPVGEGIRFEDLKSMSQIEGSLDIEFFEKLNMIDDGSVLGNKDKIKTLTLMFTEEMQGRIDMLEVMQSPPNLHWLKLWHFVVDCSNSIAISSFCNVKGLFLFRCIIPSLPILWKLQNLETLIIMEPRGLEHVGVEFIGIESNGENSNKASSSQSPIVVFPRLKKLEFHDFEDLKTWEDVVDNTGISTIMPCLVEIKVRYCKKLEDLPHALLGMLLKLRILNIAGSNHLLHRLKEDEKWAKAHWRSRVTIETTW